MGSRKKAVGILIGVGVLGALGYFLPPFRIVSLDEARAKRAQKAFQPQKFAETFWVTDLTRALERATPAHELLEMIRTDPAAAKEKHGRKAELGKVYYYFVRGVGRVVEIGDEAVAIVLASTPHSKADVRLVTANVFGNVIRNGTGLLDVNRFANSQDFNNLSLELNRIAESRVLSPFREAVSIGARVRFVGCAEIEDEERDLDPLTIVPVSLEIQRTSDSGGAAG